VTFVQTGVRSARRSALKRSLLKTRARLPPPTMLVVLVLVLVVLLARIDLLVCAVIDPAASVVENVARTVAPTLELAEVLARPAANICSIDDQALAGVAKTSAVVLVAATGVRPRMNSKPDLPRKPILLLPKRMVPGAPSRSTSRPSLSRPSKLRLLLPSLLRPRS